MIKYKRLKQVKHAVRMGGVRNALKILLVNPRGSRHLRTHRRRFYGNIAMDFKETGVNETIICPSIKYFVEFIAFLTQELSSDSILYPWPS